MKNFVLFACILISACYGCGDAKQDPKNGPVPAAADLARGKELFIASCAQCHQAQKDFVGPSLAGVETRWESREILYAFVRNSSEVIKRNEYAAALYKKWNESPMLPFPDLSDEDIAAILNYCNSPTAR